MSREAVVVPFKDLRTGRCDRGAPNRNCLLPVGHGNADAATEGVLQAYRAAGLPPPEIVWCDDPVKLSGAWGSAAAHEDAGANARMTVFDLPYRASVERIAGFAHRTSWQAVDGRCQAARAAVQSAVTEHVGDVRPRLFAWMRKWKTRLGPRRAFADSGCGPLDLGNASFFADTLRVLDAEMARSVSGLRLISDNAGWFVPHERVCWLSPRPVLLRTDEEGRLHSATGPALGYADGLVLFAWKGTSMPRWVITQPEALTLAWIDAQTDPRVRHAMIDILTPERFVAAGGADRVGSDATGTLWKRKWTYRGAIIDSWAAVEIAGSFRCVPAHFMSAENAFGWTSRAAPLLS
jgi:hypothetical protein